MIEFALDIMLLSSTIFHLLSSFIYYCFDLIVKKYETNNIPKCTPFWHEMFKIASDSGAPPQTPLRELTTLPRTDPPIVVMGFFLFEIAASIAPLALAIFPTQMFICPKLNNFPLLSAHPFGTYIASISFTSNMSHYLKSLKICPAGLCEDQLCRVGEVN